MARSNIYSWLMLSDSYGLNKIAQNRREKEEASEVDEVRLERAFPYDVLGFDDKFFMAEPSDHFES
jgi:hypothetical protein